MPRSTRPSAAAVTRPWSRTGARAGVSPPAADGRRVQWATISRDEGQSGDAGAQVDPQRAVGAVVGDRGPPVGSVAPIVAVAAGARPQLDDPLVRREALHVVVVPRDEEPRVAARRLPVGVDVGVVAV